MNELHRAPDLRIYNSLPQALFHYEREFVETMARIEQEVKIEDAAPSVEGQSKLQKLSYFWKQRATKLRLEQSHFALHFWPGAGLYELLLLSSRRTHIGVIYHDPVPLRKQFGFSRAAKALAKHMGPKHAPQVIAHSLDAEKELQRLLPNLLISRALHPVVTNQRTTKKSNQTVLVAGQYKPARDLDILVKLGPALRESGFETKIVGRGWPNLDGWEIDPRFVSEEELDLMLSTASVVCLPYSNYFQSGILLRALELGTLAVTPRVSFAEDVLGINSPCIVSRPEEVQSWLDAIHAVESRTVSPKDTFETYREKCDASWREILQNRDEAHHHTDPLEG